MPTSTGTYDTSTITYDQSSLSYDGFPAPLSGMPAVGVFVAWTGTPYEVDPTGGWTEISQYVRQITIRRGRQDDLQQFPPGAAQLVLDNRDRLFDPFNTAGANYANLKPRKQIKIVANWNGTEYPLYRGYVAGWPVEYADGGTDSTVTIDCFDVLTLLGVEVLDGNPLYDYMISLAPNHYFPLADIEVYDETFSGSTLTLRNSITPNYGTDAATTPSWVVDTTTPPTGNIVGFGLLREQPAAATPSFHTRDKAIVPSQLSRSLMMTRGSLRIQPAATGATGGTSGDFSFVLWFKHLSGNTTDFCSLSGQTGNQFRLNLDANGRLTALLGSASAKTAIDIQDNTTHCIVYTVTNQTPALYFDGANIGATIVTGTATFGENLSAFSLGGGITGVYQDVAWFKNRCLTAAEVQTIYNLGISSRRESSYTRVAAYLGDASLPSGLFEIDSQVDAPVDELPAINSELLPELTRIVAGEAGELFVDSTGIVRMYGDQYWAYQTRCNTSQVTFTDTGVGVEYMADVVRMDFNADQVRNSFTLNGSFGQSVTDSDATSIASVGVAGQVVDTRLADSASMESLAAELVTVYKNPKMTLEPFMSKGQQDPAYNWPYLLGLELLDRVTFKRTPAVGSAIVKDLLVQSIEHRITPGEWQTVVNGSARYTNWFIVGVSLIGGDDLLLN